MKNIKNIELPDFSDNTRKELEKNKRDTEKQLKLCLQEVENYNKRIEHFDALLGVTTRRKGNGEKSDSSVLTPTEFVNKLLNDSPNRWITIQEFLIKGRSAFDSDEIDNRGGEIEPSIHSVLTRFRVKNKVQTKGRRLTRKYKKL